MSAVLVVAIVAFLTAVPALHVSIRSARSLVATQAELASANAARDQDRQTTAEAIAEAQRSTVEEVTTLLKNVLAQVDTDITAKVAEALALMSSYPGQGVGEVAARTEHDLTSSPLIRSHGPGFEAELAKGIEHGSSADA